MPLANDVLPNMGILATIPMTAATSDPSSLRKLRSWKWRAGAGVAVLVVLAGAWLAWSQIAAARLQRVVDEIRADHDPLLPSDVSQPFIPDAKNATIPLTKALSAFSAPPYSPSASSQSFKPYPPYPAAWHRMAKAALAANQQALALARQAAQRPEIDWRGSTPAFNTARQLAMLLADGAVQAHSDGDDSLAIQRIIDLKQEAGIIDPTFHAVALGLEATAIDALEQILPDLAVETGVTAAASASGVSRPVAQAELMTLIERFLDEPRMREQLRESVADNLRWTYQHLQTLRSQATVLRPLVDLEAARILSQQGAYWRAAAKPTFADAESFLTEVGLTARWSQQLPPKSEPLRYSRVISGSSMWPPGYIIWGEWQVTIDRRAAAISIGVRLYRARHGRWPNTLQDLVPEFLPAVPRNPMIPGDKPIEYVILRGVLPGGHDRPMLRFAVGPSTAASHPLAEPSFGWGYDAEEHQDVQWRDLSRWYPAPAATEPQTMPASP